MDMEIIVQIEIDIVTREITLRRDGRGWGIEAWGIEAWGVEGRAEPRTPVYFPSLFAFLLRVR